MSYMSDEKLNNFCCEYIHIILNIHIAECTLCFDFGTNHTHIIGRRIVCEKLETSLGCWKLVSLI